MFNPVPAFQHPMAMASRRRFRNLSALAVGVAVLGLSPEAFRDVLFVGKG